METWWGYAGIPMCPHPFKAAAPARREVILRLEAGTKDEGAGLCRRLKARQDKNGQQGKQLGAPKCL